MGSSRLGVAIGPTTKSERRVVKRQYLSHISQKTANFSGTHLVRSRIAKRLIRNQPDPGADDGKVGLPVFRLAPPSSGGRPDPFWVRETASSALNFRKKRKDEGEGVW